MMNVVKKFAQVKINQRLITSLEVSFCFGNGSVGTTVWAEPVAAGMEGWLEDRLQYLKNRLLNYPVHHVRHGPVRLHCSPHNLWDRRQSPIPFIPYTDKHLRF